MLTRESQYKYNGQGRVYHEQGTLKEIGARVGDRVQDRNGMEADVVIHGGRLSVFYEGWLEPEPRDRYDGYRIISRASDEPTSPVRTVTRTTTEIVDGVYGRITVHGMSSNGIEIEFNKGDGWMFGHTGNAALSRTELTAAIQTLTEIRDALA